jgi:hypothetical protein
MLKKILIDLLISVTSIQQSTLVQVSPRLQLTEPGKCGSVNGSEFLQSVINISISITMVTAHRTK